MNNERVATLTRRGFLTASALAVGCATRYTSSQGRDRRLSTVQGVIYTPSYACNSMVFWEHFDEAVITRELDYARDAGFNSIKTFLQFACYVQNRRRFVKQFNRLVHLCDVRGMTLAPVLFDASGDDPAYGAQQPGDAGPWVNSLPVSSGLMHDSDVVQAYLKDIAISHKNDPRIALWECVNEPVKPSDQVLTRHTIEYLEVHGVTQPVCACWGVGDALGDITVLHFYQGNYDTLSTALALAYPAGKKVLLSLLAGALDSTFVKDQIAICREQGVGWYVWELMERPNPKPFMLGKIVIPGPDKSFHGLLTQEGAPRSPIDWCALNQVSIEPKKVRPAITWADIPLPAPREQSVRMPDLSKVRGANYFPSYAANTVVLWDYFDPAIIDRELGYAADLNLNSVRMMLQYLVYEKDPKRFTANFEHALTLCDKHGITMMPVLFDSCGHEPVLGRDKPYDKALYAQSPGRYREGPEIWPDLQHYIHDVVGAHIHDKRIILWDCFNEPFFQWTATQMLTYRTLMEVKSLNPVQPVSCCFGMGDAFGDICLLHIYTGDMDEVRTQVADARKGHEHVLITEMAGRPASGKFKDLIPTCTDLNIGWYFWELMIGSTVFTQPRNGLIYQGVVYPDGTPYDPKEVRIIREGL